MRGLWKRGLAVVLASAMMIPVSWQAGTATQTAKAATVYGSETEYTDGSALIQATAGENVNVTALSPDEKTQVKILKNTSTDSYYYSAGQNGENVLQASALGLVTESFDYSKNVELKNFSVSEVKTEKYDLPAGRQSHVEESYREMSFDLVPTTGDSQNKCTVIFRNYNDGIAFRYQVYGKTGETETVKSEVSEYVLPYNGTKMWVGGTSNTYEVDYSTATMSTITNANTNYTIPALASTADGKEWVLITEANVFNEENPYCSSYLKTASGERNLKVKFGNKVSSVKMTYDNGSFHTPWRVAVITDNLESLVNSSMVTNLNPAADEDTYHFSEWVKSFKADWSWWSEAGDDPIEYAPQKDYIDFAAENGWDAVCLDFGWCLWDNYKEKVKELCDYAAKKNVKIMLWYGVNNSGHAGWKDENGKAAYPTYSLRTTQQLKDQFEWAHETGVYAVKVDYYESDTQAAMKQMEECARLAAENKLCVLFHGCTMPGGENRTYPNILSYEAVFGEEYHKFGLGSPTVTTLLTYPYTRNVAGSMDFTPAALPVTSISASAGFQLAETVVFESGTLNLASSIYAYEGNPALGFLNQVDSSFEQSVMVDKEQAEPGAYVAIARKSKTADKWFVGAMTRSKKTTNIALDFLGEGTYHAVIFRDNDKGTSVVTETVDVTKDTVLKESLRAAGGIAVVIAKENISLPAQSADYYEMEDASVAETAGDAAIAANPFASGLKQVNMGYGENSHVTWKVSAAEAGVYEMDLFYKAGTDSQLAYIVNGGSPVKTGVICSGTNSIAKYRCYIELKQGENTIECYNPNANFVGLDRVAISREKTVNGAVTASDEKDYGLGADAAAMKYTYTEYKAVSGTTNAVKESAGYVGWLGNSATSYLTINVQAEKAGTYKMRLGYMTAVARDVYVSVNEGTAEKWSCSPTGGYGLDSLGYMFRDVELKEGENSITLTNPNADCPNIYSVGISTTEVVDEPENPNPSDGDSGKSGQDSEGASDGNSQNGSSQNGNSQNGNSQNGSSQNGGTTAGENGSSTSAGDSSETDDVTVGKVKKLKVTSKKKKTLTVTWKKRKGVSGYQIQYGKKKNFKGAKKVSVKKNKTKWTKKKLQSGKKYYVRIRAYKTVSGEKVYSGWSGKKSVKVK